MCGAFVSSFELTFYVDENDLHAECYSADAGGRPTSPRVWESVTVQAPGRPRPVAPTSPPRDVRGTSGLPLPGACLSALTGLRAQTPHPYTTPTLPLSSELGLVVLAIRR